MAEPAEGDGEADAQIIRNCTVDKDCKDQRVCCFDGRSGTCRYSCEAPAPWSV